MDRFDGADVAVLAAGAAVGLVFVALWYGSAFYLLSWFGGGGGAFHG